MKEFTHFIGIDQTGAVDSRTGKPKPLYCSVCKKVSEEFELTSNILIPSLTRDALKDLVSDLSKTFILVDSVLGYPKEGTHQIPLRELFSRASRYSSEGKSYGAKTAHRFFTETLLLNPLGSPSKRVPEKLANANSIFKLTPFQKNIGCGTYRVWRDLAQDLSWFTIWPQEPLDDSKATVAEGYPSLVWKESIGAKRGDTNALAKWLTSHSCKVDTKEWRSVDAMDSAALSLYAALNPQLLYNPPLDTAEGWIFGLTT